jgi:hypothetical protein
MTQTDTTSEEFVPFMSFTSLRDAHRELLKQRRATREGDGEDAFWAAVTDFLHRGEAAGTHIDNTEDREAAQSLLDYWHNQLFHAGKDTPEAVLLEYDATSQPEIPDSRCPYIGLDSFGEANKHLFYGRDQLIRELLDQVNGQPVGNGRWSLGQRQIVGGAGRAAAPAARRCPARQRDGGTTTRPSCPARLP